MADQLDQAAIFEERDREAALNIRREEGPKATGFCLYCEEPTEGRWCDSDCARQWEEEQERRQRLKRA